MAVPNQNPMPDETDDRDPWGKTKQKKRVYEQPKISSNSSTSALPHMTDNADQSRRQIKDTGDQSPLLALMTPMLEVPLAERKLWLWFLAIG